MPTRAPRDDVARAIDRELAVDRAGDRHAAKVVVVHRALQRVRPLERRAWNQARQAVGGAVAERDFADELAVDHLPDGGPCRSRAAGFRPRRHRLRDARGGQGHVQLQALADVHLNVLMLLLLEAAEHDRHGVGAGLKEEAVYWPVLLVICVVVRWCRC